MTINRIKKEKIWLSSQYYHSEAKGCKIINWKTQSKELIRLKSNGLMDCKYCLKHKKIICRCGWEFGHHYKLSKFNIKLNKPMFDTKKEVEEKIKTDSRNGDITELGKKRNKLLNDIYTTINKANDDKSYISMSDISDILKVAFKRDKIRILIRELIKRDEKK
jgi:hypothetical protein